MASASTIAQLLLKNPTMLRAMGKFAPGQNPPPGANRAKPHKQKQSFAKSNRGRAKTK